MEDLCSEAGALAGAIVLQLLVTLGRELVWRRRDESWRKQRDEWARERVYLESLRPPRERRGDPHDRE